MADANGFFTHNNAPAISFDVDDHLLGVVMKSPHLVLLKDSRIILRRDHQMIKRHVKILSGGSKGKSQEPFSSFVGSGMLTAAVCADNDGFLPAEEISRAIKELGFGHEPGLLIFIPNCSVEWLHFELAAPHATDKHIKVEKIIIDDTTNGCVESLLAYKLAGAMTDLGLPLLRIASHLKEFMTHIKTVKVVFDEEGGDVQTIADFAGTFEAATEVILVLNTAARSSNKMQREFMIKVAKNFRQRGIVLRRVYGANLICELKANEYSVTVLKCTPDILQCVDLPCSSLAWSCITENLDLIVERVYIEDQYNSNETKANFDTFDILEGNLTPTIRNNY